MKKYDYLIVGSGLFGSTFAYQMKKKGKNCLVIDKRSQLGGNIYTKQIESINVHQYGAHIFHTNNKGIWDFVNSFVPFNRYTNSPLAFYKGKLYNLPFNMNTFHQLWGLNTPGEVKEKIRQQRQAYINIDPKNLEEQALKLCGDDIYKTFIKGYTEKQWGRPATELPSFIIKRIPFRFTYDNNYFNDNYQGIPKGGYNKLINGLLKDIEVKTNTNFFDDKITWESISDKILFTGCIDEFFDYKYGRLDYRSLRFEHKILNTDNFQGNAVVNYNEFKIPFTRIIEHKHFEKTKSEVTIISHEYPENFRKGMEPYYPVNNTRNMLLYNKYKQLSNNYPKVIFGGRLAQYSYFDMDDTIEAALLITKNELKKHI